MDVTSTSAQAFVTILINSFGSLAVAAIPLLLIMPMIMKNKVLAVVLSAPISDVLSVALTLLCFVPGFYKKMNRLKLAES